MAFVDSVIVFVVSLLIGSLGIYVGARIITDTDDYTYAIVTALLGAIIWGIVSFLFGWIPLLGPLLVLVAYIGVIKHRYPGGWGTAVLVALVAWATVVAVVFVLATVGIGSPDAIGIPAV